MSPCFHRPFCCTAAVDAPAATIRLSIPVRPLWPEKSPPRPAAQAPARILLASVSPVMPNTGWEGSGLCCWSASRARAVVSVTATVAVAG